jgi:hypothetical protein
MLADRSGEQPVVRGQSPEAPIDLGRASNQPAQPPMPAKTVVLSRSKLQRPLVVRPPEDVSSGKPMAEKPPGRSLRHGSER